MKPQVSEDATGQMKKVKGKEVQLPSKQHQKSGSQPQGPNNETLTGDANILESFPTFQRLGSPVSDSGSNSTVQDPSPRAQTPTNSDLLQGPLTPSRNHLLPLWAPSPESSPWSSIRSASPFPPDRYSSPAPPPSLAERVASSIKSLLPGGSKTAGHGQEEDSLWDPLQQPKSSGPRVYRPCQHVNEKTCCCKAILAPDHQGDFCDHCWSGECPGPAEPGSMTHDVLVHGPRALDDWDFKKL